MTDARMDRTHVAGKPNNPFGMPAETYRLYFDGYDDVAGAMREAELAFMEMARARFRKHLSELQKVVS